MSTLDAANWAAVLGAALGLIAAVYSFWTVRRSHRSDKRSAVVDERTQVVIVSPKEERRYFLSVPDGVSTQDLLNKIATAIEEVAAEQAPRSTKAEHDNGP
jgi:hypothetical protein